MNTIAKSSVATAGGGLANLNALRAFAVSAVLIDHLTTILAERSAIRSHPVAVGLGHVGVLAFFVHTSLVLMLSMDRLPEANRTIRFYIRRIFRIYPLSILCVAAVVLFKIPVAPMDNGSFHFPSKILIVANLLLIQNIVGHASVLAPMWSLPFEVQMYAVLPMLHRLASRPKAVGRLLTLIAAFSVLGWAVQRISGHANILAFVPCFLAGVLAYALRAKMRPLLASWIWPVFLLMWFGLTSWGMLTPQDVYAPITWVATLFLGISVYSFHDSLSRPWNAAMEWIAKYSYGIYLSHVPIMWICFYLLPIRNPWLVSALWLAGTALMSVIAYHVIEEPMIKLGRKLTSAGLPVIEPVQSPEHTSTVVSRSDPSRES